MISHTPPDELRHRSLSTIPRVIIAILILFISFWFFANTRAYGIDDLRAALFLVVLLSFIYSALSIGCSLGYLLFDRANMAAEIRTRYGRRAIIADDTIFGRFIIREIIGDR